MFFLYIKTHNITKLKYLGFTSKDDPHKYKGSGTQWRAHIKLYGYNVTTEIICASTSLDYIVQEGLYYSQLYNIVESTEWANLKPEAGHSAFGHHHSDATKQKIRIASTGRAKSVETLKKLSDAHKGKTFSDRHKENLSKSAKGRTPPNKGVKMSNAQKLKISNANKGKSAYNKGVEMSNITKQKISNANKGRTAFNKGMSSPLKGISKSQQHALNIKQGIQQAFSIILTCPNCNKQGRGSAMKRWHFNNCKFS